MKTKLSFVILLIALNLCAQPYSLDWHTVSGGGVGTNGQYSVSGTIGQHDASLEQMSGGNYSLAGGFWSLISVVQTSGAPTLNISHSGNTVIISWPSPATGFTLQQNNNLNTINWTTSSFTVSSNSQTMSISIPSPTGNLFFRLKN